MPVRFLTLHRVALGLSSGALLCACGGSVTVDTASAGRGGAGGTGGIAGCAGCGSGGVSPGGAGASSAGASGVPGVQCSQGVDADSPPADCSGDQVDWFASPYTPPGDITVDRITVHMGGGEVALLAGTADGPGAALSMGPVAAGPSTAWGDAQMSPPVLLKAGTLYFVGFRGGCSFAQSGPEPVEYFAPSIHGPWQVDGTDNWTARLSGRCP